ncbi:three component ABC system middle component [Aliarcobacter cryaerophilus]|uniref:three component ABC system middle component n=1 Tax=Aliarcobacter cryaerophilus TaxID=28198 RepID=UPI0021B6BE85|nr:three component ABC system middle component [Aliarcobacter cryaerophilus]MCT7482403.1 DUF6521 family protein [Aliarcobacter cryaerophilus]
MLPSWENRPVTVANLLNPAFCGEIIRIMLKAYKTETNKSLPFELVFLVLPLVLHKQSRESLPSTTSKNFYEWLEENTMTKIYLVDKIKNIVSYTREAILFLIYHEAININSNGELDFVPYRKSSLNYFNNEEIEDIYKKAKMIGKWFGKIGDTKTIYAAIGIKP